MAKTKKFAIDVEITVKRTLFVDARRPNGAIDRLLSDDGWREATQYDDTDCVSLDELRYAGEVRRRQHVTVAGIRVVP